MPSTKQALAGAYQSNLEAMQRLLTVYLQRLESLSESMAYEESQALWEGQFGAKETPLSVLQKLVAVQKTTQDMMQKLQQQEAGAQQVQSRKRLKEEDWKIVELALKQHRSHANRQASHE